MDAEQARRLVPGCKVIRAGCTPGIGRGGEVGTVTRILNNGKIQVRWVRTNIRAGYVITTHRPISLDVVEDE